jgi:hypothetical protein
MASVLIAALRNVLASLRKCLKLLSELCEQLLLGTDFRRPCGLSGDSRNGADGHAIESHASGTTGSRFLPLGELRRGVKADINGVHAANGFGVGGGVNLALPGGDMRWGLGFVFDGDTTTTYYSYDR